MLIDSKSQLAKLLATENLTVEHRKVTTASFDLKNRILTIPILAEGTTSEMYDLFVGHEVSHALHSPLDGMRHAVETLKINRVILNITEDARIEKLIKRKYPGLKASFSRAYRDLFARNFFKTVGKDLNKFGFLDRMNLHFKGGASQGVVFSEVEQFLVDEVERAETWDEIVVVSQKIAAYIRDKNAKVREKKREEAEKQKQKEEQGEQGSEGSSDGEGDSEGEEDDQEDGRGDPQGQSPEESEESEDGEESGPRELGDDDEEPDGNAPQNEDGEGADGRGEESEESTTGNADGRDDSAQGGSEQGDTEETKGGQQTSNNAETGGEDKSKGNEVVGDTEEELRSLTEEAFRQQEQSLYEKGYDIRYGNVPDINLENIIVPYKHIINRVKEDHAEFMKNGDMKPFVQFRKKSVPVVSYLVKEFELRKNAEKLSRAQTAKTGELDMNRVWSYRLADDIFKKVTIVPNGQSHGLVLFIDWSGSMNNYLQPTVKQLLNLVLFCKKSNIPFQVYAFTSQFSYKSGEKKGVQCTMNAGDIGMHEFHLLNFFDSKMSSAELAYMATILLRSSGRRGGGYTPYWLSRGNTPLNESVFAAMKIVPKFRKEHNLQIVNTVFLTDGEGHDLTIPGTRSFDPMVGNRVVIRDKKTKYTAMSAGLYSKDFTTAAMQLLKKVTGTKIAGFYLISKREAWNALRRYCENSDAADKAVATFKKENSVTVTSEGYDEYYIMNAEKDVDGGEDGEEGEGFETEKSTTKGITNAFIKFNTSKLTNRVILSKFVKMIA